MKKIMPILVFLLGTTILHATNLERFKIPVPSRWPVRPENVSADDWLLKGQHVLFKNYGHCKCKEDVILRLRDPYDPKEDADFWKHNAFRYSEGCEYRHGGETPDRILNAFKVGLDLYLLITDDFNLHTQTGGWLFSFFAYDGHECHRIANFNHFPEPEEFAAVAGARTTPWAMSNLATLYADGIAWTNGVRQQYAEDILRIAAESGDPAICRNLAEIIARRKGRDNAQVRKWLARAAAYEKNPGKAAGELSLTIERWPQYHVDVPDVRTIGEKMITPRECEMHELVISRKMLMSFYDELPFEAYVPGIEKCMQSDYNTDRLAALALLAQLRCQDSEAMFLARDMKFVRRKTREWILAGLDPSWWPAVRDCAAAALNRLPADEFAEIVSMAKKTGIKVEVEYIECTECKKGLIAMCTSECTVCGGEQLRAGPRPLEYCKACSGRGYLKKKVKCRHCGGNWRHAPHVDGGT